MNIVERGAIAERAGGVALIASLVRVGLQSRQAAVALLCIALIGCHAGTEAPVKPPRLVLQITVDQLRGDLLRRHAAQFGDGGFRYLLERGTVFEDAHHRHANTETIVGHATLATGADPAQHGMVGNIWFDRASGVVTYNIEDADHRLLAGAGVDQETEIDPTQRAARSSGRSPVRILTSTFADELSLFTAGQAKVFGVSVKDRGAVSMAGHGGKAFWFDKKSGNFVTSSYYYDALPDWVVDWNRTRQASGWNGKHWELLHGPDHYQMGALDDRPYETDLAGFGRVFPHAYGVADESPYYTTLLTISPAGDELTLSFAQALVEAEGVGADAVTDYLAISFSSTDYVGHVFGPSSLEMEDNLLRLDRALAELFRFVDARVGLERTLVVLAADHGGAEAPGYLNQLGVSNARYIDPAVLDRALEPAGVGAGLVLGYHHPYVYLDRASIAARGLDAGDVERRIAAELQALDGVAHAWPTSQLASGALPDTSLAESVLRNFHPARSGDIYVIFEPHAYINDFDGLEVAATHGSPWSYDTYVPLLFAGPGVLAQTVHRRVHTVDLAPTLAAMIGCKAPSGSTGEQLREVFSGD